MKSVICFVFTAMLLCGCAPGAKFESTNNKFTGISSCQLKNVDIKTKEGVWIRFDLTKGQVQGKSADYFLSLSESTLDHDSVFTNLDAFCVGDHLWLTIDGKNTVKLRAGILSATGNSVTISGGYKDHFSLNQDVINQIKNATKIDFELSKCSSLKKKYDSVSGTIVGKDLQRLKQFFLEC